MPSPGFSVLLCAGLDRVFFIFSDSLFFFCTKFKLSPRRLQPWQPMTGIQDGRAVSGSNSVCWKWHSSTLTSRQQVWWEDMIRVRCSSSSLTDLCFIRPQTWGGSLFSSGIKSGQPLLLLVPQPITVTQHVGIKSDDVTRSCCHQTPLSCTAHQSYVTPAPALKMPVFPTSPWKWRKLFKSKPLSVLLSIFSCII